MAFPIFPILKKVPSSITKVGTDTEIACLLANTTGILSGNHTLVSGANRMVVVYASFEAPLAQNSIVPTITYGGVSMTLAVSAAQTAGSFVNKNLIYYLLEASLPSNGVKTVTITLSGYTDNDYGIYVAEYSNVKQEAPEDTDGVSESSPANTTIENSITCSAGSWILSVTTCGNPTTGSWSHNESQIEVLDTFWISPDGAIVAMTEKRNCASGTYTLSSTYSATGTRYTRVVMAIKKA